MMKKFDDWVKNHIIFWIMPLAVSSAAFLFLINILDQFVSGFDVMFALPLKYIITKPYGFWVMGVISGLAILFWLLTRIIKIKSAVLQVFTKDFWVELGEIVGVFIILILFGIAGCFMFLGRFVIGCKNLFFKFCRGINILVLAMFTQEYPRVGITSSVIFSLAFYISSQVLSGSVATVARTLAWVFLSAYFGNIIIFLRDNSKKQKAKEEASSELEEEIEEAKVRDFREKDAGVAQEEAIEADTIPEEAGYEFFEGDDQVKAQVSSGDDEEVMGDLKNSGIIDLDASTEVTPIPDTAVQEVGIAQDAAVVEDAQNKRLEKVINQGFLKDRSEVVSVESVSDDKVLTAVEVAMARETGEKSPVPTFLRNTEKNIDIPSTVIHDFKLAEEAAYGDVEVERNFCQKWDGAVKLTDCQSFSNVRVNLLIAMEKSHPILYRRLEVAINGAKKEELIDLLKNESGPVDIT